MRKWCRVGVAVLLAEQAVMAHDVPVPHVHVGDRGAVIDVLLLIAGLAVGVGGVWLLRRRRAHSLSARAGTTFRNVSDSDRLACPDASG